MADQDTMRILNTFTNPFARDTLRPKWFRPFSPDVTQGTDLNRVVFHALALGGTSLLTSALARLAYGSYVNSKEDKQLESEDIVTDRDKDKLLKTAAEEFDRRHWSSYALPIASVLGMSVLGYKGADRLLEERHALKVKRQQLEAEKNYNEALALVAKKLGVTPPKAEELASEDQKALPEGKETLPAETGVLPKEAQQGAAAPTTPDNFKKFHLDTMTALLALVAAGSGATAFFAADKYFKKTDPRYVQYDRMKKELELARSGKSGKTVQLDTNILDDLGEASAARERRSQELTDKYKSELRARLASTVASDPYRDVATDKLSENA